MIYRNTCYLFFVWALYGLITVADINNEFLFFISAELINRYKKILFLYVLLKSIDTKNEILFLVLVDVTS
jgi:hypothetical protein